MTIDTMIGSTFHIYTDGSAKGNPGPGGYGVFIEIFYKTLYIKKIITDGYRYTTNNRMELMAVIIGLEITKMKKKNKTIIFTDSKYIINAVNNHWIYKWNKNSFHKKKNKDLWKKFLSLFCPKSIFFHWVKSHDNCYANDFCDKLSSHSSKKKFLKIDHIFEKEYKKKH